MADVTLGLEGSREEALDTRTFVFRPDGPVGALPGQYLLVKLDVPEDPRRGSRSFTMANSPRAVSVLVATRMRPASPFKRALAALTPGARIPAKDSFGRFVLPDGDGPVLMLAGGVGVTPFRSMLEDLLSGGGGRPVTLVTSDRTPEAIPFRAELDGWARTAPWLRLERTVTRPLAGGSSWGGRVGRIDAAWLGSLLAEPPSTDVLVVGPPGFVDGMAAATAAAGVPKDRIRAERFLGY